VDVNATLSVYDNGQYCYEGYGSEGRWREMFEVCDYIDDRKVCQQNVKVVRKPT
jgi:hypothetical protein